MQPTTTRRAVLAGAASAPLAVAAPVSAALPESDPSVVAYAAYDALRLAFNGSEGSPDDEAIYQRCHDAELAWLATEATTARGLALKIIHLYEVEGVVDAVRAGQPLAAELDGHEFNNALTRSILSDAAAFAEFPALVLRMPRRQHTQQHAPSRPESPYTDAERSEIEAARARVAAVIREEVGRVEAITAAARARAGAA